MGSKNNPGEFDCYANALPDEPMFHLLARDPVAPYVIEFWAVRRTELIESGERPESDRAMVAEALECVQKMREWRSQNDGAWRKPTSDAEA
jgi:hypothetical protein